MENLRQFQTGHSVRSLGHRVGHWPLMSCSKLRVFCGPASPLSRTRGKNLWPPGGREGPPSRSRGSAIHYTLHWLTFFPLHPSALSHYYIVVTKYLTIHYIVVTMVIAS